MTDFIFCLIVSESEIHKVKLPAKPESVDRLKTVLREKYVNSDFVLLHEDKDVGNELVTLSDIGEFLQDLSLYSDDDRQMF